MKTRLTQKAIVEAMEIAYNNGYWSQEVVAYLDQYSLTARTKLDNILHSLYNSCQFKASSHYDLAIKHNLI